MEPISIEKINQLQAENERLMAELEDAVWDHLDSHRLEQAQARAKQLEGALQRISLANPQPWQTDGQIARTALGGDDGVTKGYHGASQRPNPAGDHFQTGDAEAWKEEHGDTDD